MKKWKNKWKKEQDKEEEKKKFCTCSTTMHILRSTVVVS